MSEPGSEEAPDLSTWIGRPPEKPKENPIENTTTANESSKVVHVVDKESSNGIDFGELLEGESEPSKEHEISTFTGTVAKHSFYVEIPEVDPEILNLYEHLPGHFIAERILFEHDPNKYLVQLASGEKDWFSQRQLRSLENGRNLLNAFQSKRQSFRATRPRRTRETPGMVDWGALSSDQSSENRIPVRTKSRRESDSSEVAISRLVSSEDSSQSDSSQTRDRRVPRSRRTKRAHHTDELRDVSEASEAAFHLTGRSRRAPRKQLKLQELPVSQRSRRSLRNQNAGKSAERERMGTRRSERTRTLPRHNMREKQEDEISVASEDESGPKIVGMKEIFPELSDNDLFRQRHRPECEVCYFKGDHGIKGILVFCQGCTNSYHKNCLGPRGTREHLVTKVGERHFVLQCRRCLGRVQLKDALAPDHGACTFCNEAGPLSKPLRERLTTRQEQLQREENGGRDPITIVDPGLLNNIANVMFRCATCQRAWHMHHMPKRVTAQTQPDESDDEDELNETELAQRRFEFYHHSWICKDCVEHQDEIGALVAWRPVDGEKYIPGCTVGMLKEHEKEYLVKWRNQSYFRTTWMPGSWIWGIAVASMRVAFMKKEENQLPKMTTKDAIPEDFFRIDIVFEVRYSSLVTNSTKEIDLARVKEVDTAFVKYKGLGYEDAIWETPPRYDDLERFADFKAAYEDYVMKKYISIPSQPSLKKRLSSVRDLDFQKHIMKRKQPENIVGGEMMEYQLEGLNWLLYQWQVQRNAILADEMGLGKTIQLIALFATLVQDHKCWPFLVVVPNSTCPNWRRETKKWAPSLRVVCYYGSSQAKKLTREFELFPKDKDRDEEYRRHDVKRPKEAKDIKAHIVVTSYEAAVETKLDLINVPWQVLVVDEGQRLKNDKGLLYDTLAKFKFPFKVLLTGTPLQNNARELFNLLQFLDKSMNAAQLEEKYQTLTEENIPELHDMIRPLLLRRTKAQVLTFLPPLAQIILPVTMSTLQKKLYRSILAQNPELMKSIFSREGSLAANQRRNLSNILVQLRKTLCHPFVYSRDIEDRALSHTTMHQNLVEASSKLVLLSIMLPKLHDRGHRVLIFSQFLDNLDILEDFLDDLGLQHRRLDGTVSSLEKQKRIDEFNAPNSPYFAFLLSTRAGGVGINLASADTVIIMDPDFNPHQDIQALSRAHRIGQNQKVLVFQIITRGTAEEKIIQIAKKKMVLDHVLIQQMDADDEAGSNLESILRHGAEALFDDDSQQDIVYDSTSIDALLDRSQIESTSAGEDKSAESQFSFARVWQNEKQTLEDGLQDSGTSTPALGMGIWDKILKERERAYQEEVSRKSEQFGRGKRKRQNVDYGAQGDVDLRIDKKDGRRKKDKGGSDTDFQALDLESDEDNTEDSAEDADFGSTSDPERAPSKSAQLTTTTRQSIKARPFKRVKVPIGPAPFFEGEGSVWAIPARRLPPSHYCSACGEVHPMGWCRLKLAGVEYCGLCGLAHVGHGRTCPHLNSETQVATLLETLKESTESRELVDAATRYLRMIRGDLAQRKRHQERMKQHEAGGSTITASPLNGVRPSQHALAGGMGRPNMGDG